MQIWKYCQLSSAETRMTAIEILIEMTEVSQFAFYRRLAKGDSLLFLRAPPPG
jgi:hypothetical protein